jgi:hypothetical protein
MQGQQLMSDQIISWSQRSWNRARPCQILHHLRRAPVIAIERRRRQADLIDLEPAGAGAVARREGAGALVHPDHDGALGVRPLCIHGFDGRAGGDGCGERRGGAAVAAHLGVSHGQDRVVVGPLPLDGGRAAGGAEALITRVGRPANDIAGDGAVGRCLSDQQGGDCQELRKHREYLGLLEDQGTDVYWNELNKETGRRAREMGLEALLYCARINLPFHVLPHNPRSRLRHPKACGL